MRLLYVVTKEGSFDRIIYVVNINTKGNYMIRFRGTVILLPTYGPCLCRTNKLDDSVCVATSQTRVIVATKSWSSRNRGVPCTPIQTFTNSNSMEPSVRVP